MSVPIPTMYISYLSQSQCFASERCLFQSHCSISIVCPNPIIREVPLPIPSFYVNNVSQSDHQGDVCLNGSETVPSLMFIVGRIHIFLQYLTCPQQDNSDIIKLLIEHHYSTISKIVLYMI